MDQIQYIQGYCSASHKAISNTLELLQGGATLPFIARYRKEATGGLDEVAIDEIQRASAKYEELQKRKVSILTAIEEQGKLTEELKGKIESSYDLTALEDLYLPYRQKRKTLAEIARNNGLEPLAKQLLSANAHNIPSLQKYLNNEVSGEEDALQGARYIISEWISENPGTRDTVRNSFERSGILSAKVSKGKEEDAAKYRDYFDYSEPLHKAASHRVLALLRASEEGLLKIKIRPNEEFLLEKLDRFYVRNSGGAAEQVSLAVKDAWKRLLLPSIEKEYFNKVKEEADKVSISVFVKNLEQLLLAPPLGHKSILAIDPGFRTGCKVVCLNRHGDLLHNETIFPHEPQRKSTEAIRKLSSLIDAYKIEAIAIGNGTAGRETERLVQRMNLPQHVNVFVVSEDGASIYSASKTAREEFPQYDVTVRGAVSIGRRLMDPLSELVKIDPKSLGVGQYQHDVDQKQLKAALDFTVEKCVNQVGVELNTASKHLLAYVAGVGPALAANIVEYRKENGPIKSRKDLLKVPRLGKKVYEQCAGFLRIKDGQEILDSSAVHPERYTLVQRMAQDLNTSVHELIANPKLVDSIRLKNYASGEVGLPTLEDIAEELKKPGRDPRDQVRVFKFSEHIKTIDDLKPGMVLPGLVTNMTNFGAFVDLGIKENGLIHISQITDRFIKDPSEVLHLQEQLMVKVIEVDPQRKRIALSLKEL